jgi:hypothetical protein
MRKEIHARDLVAGRGSLGKNEIGKWRRSRIFYEILELIASLPDAHLFNVCLEVKGNRDPQLKAWDRLLNRLNRTAEARNSQERERRSEFLDALRGKIPADVFESLQPRLAPYSAQVITVADEGREYEIERLRRKMGVANFVPSKYGSWGGERSKNLPLGQLIEDVLFRKSADSYLIQLADCAAFALLKRESMPPTRNVAKYNIHKAWDKHLKHIAFLKAAADDPDGIVRR